MPLSLRRLWSRSDSPMRTSLPNSASVGFAAILALGVLGGCSKHYIPNTDVEDTGENRKVITYCEEYRKAVEEKNVPALLKMAHARYYEDGGNAKPEDDIDYDGLKDYLTSNFLKTNAIRYEIRYRKITFTERKDVYIDYTYTASYRIPGLKNEEWRHTVADNRIVLVHEGDSFRITSGM